ncbi:hypothetical protein C8F04DRAFT_1201438 [Mycena alexandri]|uniref:Uncharacterized protein n=1 Tax=Mycena alexandri TaxID=1745969 RepID=A0AAD6RX47_9AGAR|nr:hypothetical protein C8F04DRAFT_1201438 [Mycena alexandri]
MLTTISSGTNSQHRVLADEDQKIERFNDKLLKSLDNLDKAENAVRAKEQELLHANQPEKRTKLEVELEKKRRGEERARKTFEKLRLDRESLKGGSGKVAKLDYP